MKTNDLINLLAEDAPVPFRLDRAMAIAVIAGTVLSICLLSATIGFRSDLATAIENARVAFKILATLVLALAACGLVFRIGRPGVPLKARILSLVAPLVLIAGAVGVELIATPSSSWAARLMGRHAMFCMFFIPVLSLAPLVGFMLVLRNTAPSDPGVAGAVAGLAAGAIAAAIYAWHCPDDSPLFFAAWYLSAIGLVTAIGYGLGQRLLRW